MWNNAALDIKEQEICFQDKAFCKFFLFMYASEFFLAMHVFMMIGLGDA